MITRIREIPDTTIQFDGFFIGIDWFAMTFTEAGVPRFKSTSGKVEVRNVVLPAGYLHVSVPTTHHLPGNAEWRRFIETYRPARRSGPTRPRCRGATATTCSTRPRTGS